MVTSIHCLVHMLKATRSHSDVTGRATAGRNSNQSAPRRRATFTATYVRRSLGGGLDMIGQAFDQLQLERKQSAEVTKSHERSRFVSITI